MCELLLYFIVSTLINIQNDKNQVEHPERELPAIYRHVMALNEQLQRLMLQFSC